jgi:hypothetical protein
VVISIKIGKIYHFNTHIKRRDFFPKWAVTYHIKLTEHKVSPFNENCKNEIKDFILKKHKVSSWRQLENEINDSILSLYCIA